MEEALQELDSQMEELRKVQEEQDVLAAKTAEVTILMRCYCLPIFSGDASCSAEEGEVQAALGGEQFVLVCFHITICLNRSAL